jgi:hypothetical protein
MQFPRGEWAQHADLYAEHAIGLILRRTRTELIETIERSRAIYSPLGWKYNETEKMWRAPNGARLPLFGFGGKDALDAALSVDGVTFTHRYVVEVPAQLSEEEWVKQYSLPAPKAPQDNVQ